MGDSNEPLAFMVNYYRAIDKYLEKTFRLIGHKLHIVNPLDDVQVPYDLSAFAFIDDVLRFIVLDHDIDALLASNHDSVELARALTTRKYEQNSKKAEIIASLNSRNNYTLFRKDTRIIGKFFPNSSIWEGT